MKNSELASASFGRGPGIRGARGLRVTTALCGGALILLAMPATAFAQSGGAGGVGVGSTGGKGGDTGQAGAPSVCNLVVDPACQAPGGAVGPAPNGNGGNGTALASGAGGGGSGFNQNGTANGGKGGDGATATAVAPTNSIGGGGGGAGGVGYLPIGNLLINAGAVTGGNGGNGGAGIAGTANAANGGGGGDGGNGITQTPGLTSIEIRAAASVTGGNGGIGGAGSTGTAAQTGAAGANGRGGVGILGSGLAVTIGGTVSGGLGGDGVTRANAIVFGGGTNRLTFTGSTGGLVGNIDLTGTLEFRQAVNTVLASAITGSGSITKTGGGILTLSGASTYSGTTTIEAGALLIQNGSGLGSAAGGTTVQSGAALQIQGGIVISDALTINGTGIANGGALRSIGSNGVVGVVTLGSDALITTDNGRLELYNDIVGGGNMLTLDGASGVIAFSGTLSGLSSVVKNGDSSAGFFGTSTYAGSTTVNAGILQFSSGTAIADTAPVIINGGRIIQATSETIGSLAGAGGTYNLLFNSTLTTGGNNSDTIFSGAIVGTGALVKSGTGTFTLAADNAYGVTMIDAGNLRVGNGGTMGTLGFSDVVNNAALTFDRSDVMAVGNVISGSGNLVQAGSGTTILVGANSYNGGTAINAGVLQVGNAGALGTGGVTLNGGTLRGGSTLTLNNNIAIAESSTSTISAAAGTTLSLSLSSFVLPRGTPMTVLRFGSATDTGTVALSSTSTSLPNFSGGFDVEVAGGTLRDTIGTVSFLTSAASVVRIAAGGTLDFGGDIGTIDRVEGVGTITGNSQILIENGDFGGTITGDASLRAGLVSGLIGQTHLLRLTGTNSYTGGTNVARDGTLELGGSGSILGDVDISFANATFRFARSSDTEFTGVIRGIGTLAQQAAGTTVTLTGSNSTGNDFTGTVNVNAGTLAINSSFGDTTNAAASLVVNNGGTLAGSGTFLGDVAVGNGGALNPGNSPGTLTIAGNLALSAGTILNFELAQAGLVGGGINDLVNVGGNLTLDGTLNVIALPGFGAGYYRLFNYGGTFTDNGLNFGTLPGGYDGTLQTGIAGQVNILFNDGAQQVQYWDGGDTTGVSNAANGDGGSGTWSASNTNWTAPTGFGVNGPWASQVGVFAGTAGGTIAIDGTQAFQELRFDTGGYVLNSAPGSGGLSTTGGFSVINVGAPTATINAPISGAGGLTKIGAGTLVLGGANSYAGIITVSGGTLSLTATGSIGGAVQNDATFLNAGTVGGVVANNGALTSTGILNAGLFNAGVANLQGQLNGNVANNAGTITLTGATTGIAQFAQGASAVFDIGGFDTTVGSLSGAGGIALGGATLTAGGNNGSTVFAGTIAGTGGLTKTGTGTLTLAGANVYSGATNVAAGTLAFGASNILADSSALSVASGATLDVAAFNDTVATAIVGGTVNGTGTLTASGYLLNGATINANLGTGTLTQGSGNSLLAGASAADAVNVAAGTLALGASDRLADTANVNIASGASFDLANFSDAVATLTGTGTLVLGSGSLTAGTGADFAFGGTIAGSGNFTKVGGGTLALTGPLLMTGRLNVNAGTLLFAGTSAGGASVQGGTLTGAGSFAGNLALASGTLSPGIDTQPIAAISAASFTGTGGTYAVSLGGAANDYMADLLNIGGAATLSGVTVSATALEATASYRVLENYVILQAGSLSGTFANGSDLTAVANNPNLRYRLRYDLLPNAVVLELRRQVDLVAALGPDATPNQINVANAVNGAVFTASDSFVSVLDRLSLLPTGDLGAAYDNIGGEALTGVTTAAALSGNRFVEMIQNRLALGGGVSTGNVATVANMLAPVSQGGMARALSTMDAASSLAGDGENGLSTWLVGYGADGSIKGHPGQAKLDNFSAGAIGGIEANIGSLTVGIAGSIVEVDAKVRARASRNEGTLYQGGAYAAYDDGATYGNAVFSYFDGTIDTTRTVVIGSSLIGQARGEADTHGYAAGASLGHRFEIGGGFRFAPQIAGQMAKVTRDAFVETGIGPLNLAAAKEKRDLYQIRAEGRLSHRSNATSGAFEPYLSGGVQFNMGDRDAIAAMRITGAPTGSGAYRIEGAQIDKTQLLLGAGIEANPDDNTAVGVGIDADIGKYQTEARVRMRVRVRF